MSKWTLLMLLIFSNGLVKAASDIPYSWNSVTVEANNGVYVNLKLNERTRHINHFEVSMEGEQIVIDEFWYADIENPELSSIKITSGCAPIIIKEEELIRNCSSHIKFKFWEETESDEFPGWHEDPEVVFYFKEGVLTERLVKKKDSKHSWKLIWKEKDGTESKGSIKSLGGYNSTN